jgi:methionyl-tRNA formyltransferase
MTWSRANLPAVEIERLIRGLKPWPGTFTHYKGKILKILDAQVLSQSGPPGVILDITKEGFMIACSKGSLLVKKVHLEASKPSSAYDFVQGHHLTIGEQL